MSYDPSRIRLRVGGLARVSFANEIAQVVNGLNPPGTLGGSRPPNKTGFWFTGYVVEKGPSNEAEPTNETYWIQMQYVPNNLGNTCTFVADDNTFTNDPDTDAYSIILATNLCERSKNPEVVDQGVGTHFLRLGLEVQVFMEMDDLGNPRWVMFVQPPDSVVADITFSSGADGTNSTPCAYKYTAKYRGTTLPLQKGEALSVSMGRPNGKTTHAGIGLCVPMGNNHWDIVLCDEQPNFAVKTVLVAPIVCNGDGTVSADTQDILSPS